MFSSLDIPEGVHLLSSSAAEGMPGELDGADGQQAELRGIRVSRAPECSCIDECDEDALSSLLSRVGTRSTSAMQAGTRSIAERARPSRSTIAEEPDGSAGAEHTVHTTATVHSSAATHSRVAAAATCTGSLTSAHTAATPADTVAAADAHAEAAAVDGKGEQSAPGSTCTDDAHVSLCAITRSPSPLAHAAGPDAAAAAAALFTGSTTYAGDGLATAVGGSCSIAGGGAASFSAPWLPDTLFEAPLEQDARVVAPCGRESSPAAAATKSIGVYSMQLHEEFEGSLAAGAHTLASPRDSLADDFQPELAAGKAGKDLADRMKQCCVPMHEHDGEDDDEDGLCMELMLPGLPRAVIEAALDPDQIAAARGSLDDMASSVDSEGLHSHFSEFECRGCSTDGSFVGCHGLYFGNLRTQLQAWPSAEKCAPEDGC